MVTDEVMEGIAYKNAEKLLKVKAKPSSASGCQAQL